MMPDDPSTIGDAILEVLRAYGVDCIFSSPGSEWPPLWDALARAKAGGKGPRFINTRHEELAVTSAIGHYRQTGKLPAVVLHTADGTLHGATALRSAQLGRVPMVVLAGDSAGYGEMPGPDPGFQWARFLSNVGGSAYFARPYVKRSSSVTCPEVLLGMLQDTCRLALTPAFGPVFLGVPLEFMLGPCPPLDIKCTPPPLPPRADASALEKVAEQLLKAERPVLLTEYAGREPRNVRPLVELAESLAMPVVEADSPVFLNFPRDHALHQGFDGSELLEDADLVLLVADQMPWYPASRRPRNARIILIDDDPAHELMHYWGVGVDQVIGGDLTSSLEGLSASVRELKTKSSANDAAYRERWSRWQRRHDRNQEEWRAQAMANAQRRPMDARWATFAIAEALPPDAIVTEEVTTQTALLLRYVARNLAGHYFNCKGGGLGQGVGTALGMKLGAPDCLVAAVVGDGAFNYNPILAAFGFAQQFGLPILVCILNNQGYAVMKTGHLHFYPDGWSARTNTFFGTEIEPQPDYVGIAESFGGCGERVEDPQSLPEALRRAIARVKGGQLALLDIVVDPFSHMRA